MRFSRFVDLQARTLAGICLFIILSPHSALGAKGATIRLPDELANSVTTIRFEGFGGFNRGEYRGGEFRGTFTRIESRLGVFDPLYVANRGKSSFTIEDPSGTTQISADCRATQNTATIRVVTLDLKKLTYVCDFNGPEASEDLRFIVGEPKREGFKEKLMDLERRRGEAFVLGQEILIESVHEYEGSKLKSQAPLGYLLKSGGVVIAAIDLLDWNPIVHVHQDLADSAKRAAAIVALALAVLRDPANSALED